MVEVNNADKPVLGRIPVNTPELEALRNLTSAQARIAERIARGAQENGSKISKAAYDEKGWHITLVQPDGSEVSMPTFADDEAAMFFGVLGKPEQSKPK